MQRYIRVVDPMKRVYAVECGTAVVDGDVHAHALEPNGDVGELYRLPYEGLVLAGAVYLSHDLTHWLASDERVLPNGEKKRKARRKSAEAFLLQEAVVMRRIAGGNGTTA